MHEAEVSKEYRMYLVVRDDLEAGVGKWMGQAGHAFSTALLQEQRHDPDLIDLYYADNQPKIIVKCKNLEALLRAERECRALELNLFVVTDAGRTVFPEPTQTCMAIGPCRRSDLPKYIQKMQLF